uniref:Uncharacterized protein n=1 Tax=Palpitomonas bilix TaxID=652834 RepID=A0A7S3DM98_9EUKA|mmetsp:Transcript_43092/g.111676  ORF Transcript_43092/g.111676 Transcript_43092/m.111676 type:complete len:165 (+) Transcript_43092:222-716(+)
MCACPPPPPPPPPPPHTPPPPPPPLSPLSPVHACTCMHSYDDKEEFLTRAEAEEFGHLLVVFSNFAVRILKKTLSFVDPTFSVKMMLASLFAAILFQILPASLIFYAAVIVPFYAVRSSDSLREYIRAADKVVDSSLHTFASSVAKQAEDLSGRISKAGKGKKD